MARMIKCRRSSSKRAHDLHVSGPIVSDGVAADDAGCHVGEAKAIGQGGVVRSFSGIAGGGHPLPRTAGVSRGPRLRRRVIGCGRQQFAPCGDACGSNGRSRKACRTCRCGSWTYSEQQ